MSSEGKESDSVAYLNYIRTHDMYPLLVLFNSTFTLYGYMMNFIEYVSVCKHVPK